MQTELEFSGHPVNGASVSDVTECEIERLTVFQLQCRIFQTMKTEICKANRTNNARSFQMETSVSVVINFRNRLCVFLLVINRICKSKFKSVGHPKKPLNLTPYIPT
jgi:hypothetical protein